MPPAQPPPDLIETAFPAFERARDEDWPAPSSRIAAIHQALARRLHGRARELLRAESREHPGSDQVTFLDSVVLLQTARYADARPGFEQVLERGPTFAGSEFVYYFYGTCLMRLGEGERAEKSYLALLELRPAHGETLQSLGLLELERGNPTDAIPLLEQALEAFTALEQTSGVDMLGYRAEIRGKMGEAYLQLGELERALRSLEASIDMNAMAPAPHYALSRVLTRQGDREGARRAMEDYQRTSAATRRQPRSRPENESERAKGDER